MPSPVLILLIATLLPLVAFVILLAIGRRMGTPLAGWVSVTFIAGSFLCSLAAMFQWYTASGQTGATWGWNRAAIHLSTRWIPTGGSASAASAPTAGWMSVGIYLDSLTIAMVSMVTLVALLVQVFSIGYMRGDNRFSRYFAYLSLFCFSMLGLVLSSTLIQLFIFWELVGFCSYLLIGFWFERKEASQAALKAFVVNRIGDCCFLIGFGLLFAYVGNASLPQLWALLGSAGQGGDVVVGGATLVPAGVMTAIGVLLFLGACGKSAQFPLHVWLPDAMEGPSPVSALIHAATMVAAGVYLIARVFPLLTPDAKLVIAFVGCLTLLIGALMALAQTDIKRVLAYSTISQLGYMMLAIGVGSWGGALFHLITHAFFKALLFLGAGAVIHAAHHEQDLRQYGGLWRRLPVTALCFGIAVLAISGVGIGEWGFSGYYSKSIMLGDAASFALWGARGSSPQIYWLLFAVPAVVAYLTPFYMMRCWMLTFWGKPRNADLFDRATETPMMYVPLLGLAMMSVIGGWRVMSVRDLMSGSINESGAVIWRLKHAPQSPSATASHRPLRDVSAWSTAWPADQRGLEEAPPPESGEKVLSEAEIFRHQGHELEKKWLTLAWPLGLLAGFLLYFRGYQIARWLNAVPPLSWIRTWLLNRMYIDELYAAILVGVAIFLSRLAGWIDRQVIDGVVNLAAGATTRLSRAVGWGDDNIVDGAAVGMTDLAWQIGVAARSPQTGKIRLYVTALMAAVVIGLAVTVGVMMWK